MGHIFNLNCHYDRRKRGNPRHTHVVALYVEAGGNHIPNSSHPCVVVAYNRGAQARAEFSVNAAGLDALRLQFIAENDAVLECFVILGKTADYVSD